MSDESRYLAAPAAPDGTRGTITSEELSAIVARARGELAGKAAEAANVETLADTRAREAEARRTVEAWLAEQREVRAIDADARAQRGAANIAFARGVAVTAGGALTGFLVAGPVGGIILAGLAWAGDRLVLGGRS